MKASIRLWGIALLVAGSIAYAEDYNLPKGPCGTKPLAPPQRRKGGEGFAPLPLPVTPLRRTEKKRAPSPPPLIAKIQFGTQKEVVIDGQTIRYDDWNKDPGDIQNLLLVAGKELQFNYTSKSAPLATFPDDPAEYPIYYYTGSEDFTLSDEDVAHLRKYIQAGGTVWGNTCYGDPDFFKAFIREMGRVLPDRSFRQLPPDNPIFNSFYRIDKVAYTRAVPDAPNGEPIFFGMDMGCRTAVVLSRYGLSCGWDGHIRDGAFNVHPNDARKLGVNMIAYALATFRLGESQGVEVNYYENAQPARGEFVLAQARLGENWDSQHNSIAGLLKAVAAQSSAEIKFERKVVDLSSKDLQSYPFLYMTGHYDFKLSDSDRAALKRYLASGGFILAAPCCGAKDFDRAFRREIAAALPDAHLVPLPASHPVYNIMNKIAGVSYSPYADSTKADLPALPLEGITIGGSTPVIYCPYGLGGWRGFDHPFGMDLSQADAIKVGVNVVLYSLTN